MGRAERRQAERKARIEDRKGKILLSYEELANIKEESRIQGRLEAIETITVCCALAERRAHKFGHKRVNKTVEALKDILQEVLEQNLTIKDLKAEAKEQLDIEFHFH